ncbi:MAG: outer membrane beta-barrel protein [Ferruginibacter sp.]
MYATPSVIYKGFSNNAISSNLAPAGSNQSINNTIWEKPSVGLEAGTALLYSISPVVKLKAGLQFNYSQYNTEAPINSIEDETSMTYHNEIYQISLPVGTEVRLLAFNKNIQLNVGLTLQPTYITGSNSYSESLSKQENIIDGSLLNNWNLNAGFETFISYKANDGYTWKIGPAIRYQLFSTYNNSYLPGENLTNFEYKLA